MTFLSHTARVALLTAFATPALADLGPLVTPAELAAALQTDAPLVLDTKNAMKNVRHRQNIRLL